MNSIDDMERRLPAMEADLTAYQKCVADLRGQAAAAEARIAEQRAEAATLRARAEELEARIAHLESGPEPIQCSMGRPSRADGVSQELAERRPLFAQALARRDALVRAEGLSRAAAWERVMREDATLRERLIREAANAGGER